MSLKKKKGKGKRAPSLPTPSVHWAQAAGARGSPPGEGVGAEGSDIDAAGHWRRCPTRLAPRRAEECHGCIGVKPQGCRAWISPAQVRVNKEAFLQGLPGLPPHSLCIRCGGQSQRGGRRCIKSSSKLVIYLRSVSNFYHLCSATTFISEMIKVGLRQRLMSQHQPVIGQSQV